MQEIKRYQCDFCKLEYMRQQDAEKCERNHKRPISVKEAMYKGLWSDGYPSAVYVRMDDGKVKKYAYEKGG